MKVDSKLKVDKLEVIYNRAAMAIQGVSFEVPENKIVALLGVNGAGKTTTARAVCGFLSTEDVAISDGSVEFRGERLNGMAPHQIAHRGIIPVPERDKIFVNLSVEENLQASVHPGSTREQKQSLEKVYTYFPKLKEIRQREAGYISGGERQMLAIGAALMCAPRLMVADEMSLGLAPVIVNQLMLILKKLRDDLGMSILIIEQNVRSALNISDYGYVMENGRIVFDGTPEKLLSSDDVKEFYLGMGKAAETKSYSDVKQYRRVRRWWG